MSGFIHFGILSFFWFIGKNLSISFIFPRTTLLVLLRLSTVPFCSISLISSLTFAISFHLPLWGLYCSCFPEALRFILELFIWGLSVYKLEAKNVPLRTAFLDSKGSDQLRFYFFHLILRIFQVFLTDFFSGPLLIQEGICELLWVFP